MSRFLNAGSAASLCFLALSSACSEPSGPSTVELLTPASVAAVSPLQLTGVVGSNVSTPPSVIVTDSKGSALPGIPVNFSVSEGSGKLSGSSQITDATGVASVSGLTLDARPGLTAVIASVGSLPSIRFEVTAVAGPPAAMGKIAGDGQIAARGTAVPIKPQVQVVDSHSNPLTGVVVTFEVGSGGGSLTGETATTDSSGIATLGSWTLGTSGSQKLVVKTANVAPIMFAATTFEVAEACTSIEELASDSPITSVLNAEGCQREDGRFVQYYAVRLGNAGSWKFKLSSPDFDTRLELQSGLGILLAADRPSAATMDAEISAMLPAGTYLAVVTSANPEGIGRYELSYTTATSVVGGCEVSIARGFSTGQDVSGGRCDPIGDRYVDRYRVYLTAGSTLSILLNDYSLSDNRFEIQDDTGKGLAPGVVRNYIESTLDYTAPADGFYLISVWVAERYELYVE